MNDIAVVVTHPDGKVSILYPTDEGLSLLGLEGVIAKDVPNDCSCRITTRDSIPEDRTFREAWKDNNKDAIDVDMDKARDIQLNKLRNVRNQQLTTLDREAMKNLVNPEVLQEIEDKKKVLRDMPELIEDELKSIETPDMLKEYVPDMLKESDVKK